MTAKKKAEVIIGGEVYTLSGYEEEEYLQKVASYINDKIAEFNGLDEYRKLPVDTRHTLLELNIADDYFKAKEAALDREANTEAKEKEIYDLKHELIAGQLQIEDLEARIKELENQNKELTIQKSKLEASLEDALLGGISN